jgi:uncharacterized protein DUF6603
VAEDVWTSLVKGLLHFGRDRALDLIQESFQDTKTLVHTLRAGVNDQNTKGALQALETAITDLTAEGQAIIDACEPDIQSASDAAAAGAADLATDPFTLAAAGRAATDLATILIAWDAALVKVAEAASHKADPANFNVSVYDTILAIDAPYKAVFANLGAGIGGTLDAIASELVGQNGATQKLGEALKVDRANRQLTMSLLTAGQQNPIAAFPGFSLVDSELTAFLNYRNRASIGILLRTRLKVDLRSDVLLQTLISGDAATDTDYTTFSLDSNTGLSFGDGGGKSLMLPGRFSFPGVELRGLAVTLPDAADSSDQNDQFAIKATLAGSLSVVGFIVDGAGVAIRYRPNPGAGQLPFDIAPRLPDAAGVSLDVGVAKGGGYVYRKGNEYGGVLDLQLLEIGVTVVCIINTDPFSMVVMISVRFFPKIELSFGFTLNGLGGILALGRRVNSDALNQGIQDGSLDTILFPTNAVEAAPRILDKVGNIFPAKDGNFVAGPIALLGWGSQAGFVVAKIGIVLSLPDPELVILGAVQIGVPSVDVPEYLRIVDMRAELYGALTPDYFLIRVALNNSKIANVSVSGDIGLFIRWAGGANFAVSVGGFHPQYAAPPELAGLRRIVIDYSPGGNPFVKLVAEGYFAITANSLQVGGKISLLADIGAASGEAWIGLDALFVWSPHFYFRSDIDVGICVRILGETVCGAGFHGSLEGTTPFRLEGSATVDLGFLGSHDFDLPLIQWGADDNGPQTIASPRDIAAKALDEAASWKPQLPAGGDMLVRLVKDDAPLLVHPLGLLEIKQQKIPLETRIDRVGSSAVDAHFINLSSPQVNGADAAAVTHTNELFAPGHFIDLTRDQQMSQPDFESFPAGLRLSAAKLLNAGQALPAAYQWETCFPQEESLSGHVRLTLELAGYQQHVLRLSPVSQTRADRVNPYQTEKAEKVAIADTGSVLILRRDDLAAIPQAPGVMTTTAALKLRQDLALIGMPGLELVALGVTK